MIGPASTITQQHNGYTISALQLWKLTHYFEKGDNSKWHTKRERTNLITGWKVWQSVSQFSALISFSQFRKWQVAGSVQERVREVRGQYKSVSEVSTRACQRGRMPAQEHVREEKDDTKVCIVTEFCHEIIDGVPLMMISQSFGCWKPILIFYIWTCWAAESITNHWLKIITCQNWRSYFTCFSLSVL